MERASVQCPEMKAHMVASHSPTLVRAMSGHVTYFRHAQKREKKGFCKQSKSVNICGCSYCALVSEYALFVWHTRYS